MSGASQSNVASSSHVVSPSSRRKATRVLSIGWLNFNHDAGSGKFAQVRLSKGGGLRSIHVLKTATKIEIIQQAQDIFFPADTSLYGNKVDFDFDLTNFSNIVIDSRLTVDELYTAWGLPTLRMYLTSKKKTSVERSLDLNSMEESGLSYI